MKTIDTVVAAWLAASAHAQVYTLIEGVFGAIDQKGQGETTYGSLYIPFSSKITEGIATGMNLDNALTNGWGDVELTQVAQCFTSVIDTKSNCYVFQANAVSPYVKVFGWVNVATADIPTFTNGSTLDAQATTAFGAACATMQQDSTLKAVDETVTPFECTDTAAFPHQKLSLNASLTGIDTEECPKRFGASIELEVTYADANAAAAANVEATLKARLSPFVSATYFKGKTGEAMVTTEASTTVTAKPASYTCPDAAETGASTLTAVGAALVLAAIF